MRYRSMALLVVLMFLASPMATMADTSSDLSSEPTNVRPDLAKEPLARVVDIVHYLDDQDGDRLYDAIQIVTKLSVNTSGDLIITTKLSPLDDSWWFSTQEPFSVDPEANLPVEPLFGSSFEGWKLFYKRVNGFLVVTTEVTTASGTLLAKHAETLDEQFQYTQFESTEAGATITGVGDPVKLDFDGNGYFEIVEVPVQVDASTPGLYRLVMVYSYWWPARDTGSVSLAGRTLWQTVVNETQLRAGSQTVPMWISGGHMKTSDNTTVHVTIYKSAFAGKSLSFKIEITDRTVFESPRATIWDGTHTEEGQDLDGDRMFDLMSVKTGLSILYPGVYTLTAVLLPTGATVSAADGGSLTDVINRLLAIKKAAKDTWKASLGPGDAEAEFIFDGHLINAWGHDGTFELHVFWTGPAPFIGYYYRVTTIEFRAGDFVHPVPPLEFAVGHSDGGVSQTGGALYEGLRVSFNVYVNTPGQYTAFATLVQDGKEIAYARTEVELERGPGSIDLVFPGQAIYLSEARGAFDCVVWVQGAGYDWNDTTLQAPLTAKHRTAAYSYEQFVPPVFEPGPKDPRPVEDLTFLLLQTGIISVRIDRSKPDLTFYMAEDEGRTALFRVLYTRLLAFEDANGDGAPQAGEVTYTSNLMAYDWQMTQVSLTDDPETGRVASFSLSAIVDLVEYNTAAVDEARPLSTVKDFATITLEFTLASRDSNRTDEVGDYIILGGAELKVDVHIDVLTPVDGIDFLTLEQSLRDERDRYRPRLPNAASDEPGEDVSPYQQTSDTKQRVEFVRSAATPAFYSWVRRAEVTKTDGSHQVVDVRAAYLYVDGRALLYLSYPYDVNTSYIFHDPSLGIYEGGFPVIPEEWKAVFDPLLFGVSALAAVAMVLALRSRGGRDEEMEGDEGEEDEGPIEEEVRELTPEKAVPPPPPPPDDGIESLPEEPEANGSTILLQPPPTPEGPVREDWAEWED
jgi:hypothetical protein